MSLPADVAFSPKAKKAFEEDLSFNSFATVQIANAYATAIASSFAEGWTMQRALWEYFGIIPSQLRQGPGAASEESVEHRVEIGALLAATEE